MSQRPFCILTACAVIVAGAGPALAGSGFYDINQFMFQPHPFTAPAPAAQAPATPPAAAAPPPASAEPAAPAPAAPASPRRHAQKKKEPTRKSAAPPAPEYDGKGLKGGFYLGATVVGSPYSVANGHKTSNITNLEVRHDTDQVAGNALVAGYSWRDKGWPVRAEIEGGVRYRFDLDYRGQAGTPATTYGYGSNVATMYGMVNAYYDFLIHPSWVPYVGAGLGLARHWADTDRDQPGGSGTKISNDTYTNNFSWAVMAGVTYNWSPNWGVNMGARYVDLGTIEVGTFADGDKIEADYWAIDVILGLTYAF